MKRYLILLFYIILPLISISQDINTSYIELDTTNINIDYELTLIVLDNFVTDACKYGLDSSKVVNHIKYLDAIYTDNLMGNKLGVTMFISDSLSPTGIRGIIIIDNSLLFDYSIFQLTIYHELGHWFGLNHKKRGIMMRNSKNVYKVLNNWGKNVGKMMKKIKKGNYSFPELYLE